MAGRATQSHPDVEALQAELAALEAQKHTVQTEMLGIATDKKRLHEEFEADKAKLDEELAQAHRNGGAELEILDEAIATAKTGKQQAEREFEEAQSKARALEGVHAAHSEATNQLASTQEAVKVAEKELAQLVAVRQEAEKAIASYRFSFEELAVQKKALAATLAQQKTDVEHVSGEHDALKISLYEVQQIHADYTARKEGAAVELDGIRGQINERLAARTELESEITVLGKQKAVHAAEMAEKDAGITERAARASRLEALVDEKLQHLKELENRFTTEHLARMGYSKTE
jgi:chromosome segregation ATPase